uniref:Guanine nucleotide binding protein, alpha stimulating, olfactory type n=1 Tax=Mus musculus TaxID=10090 RepID=A0A494BA65_MOUSE
MGLCYSLRPLLFGSPEDTPCAASEPCAEDAQPSAAPAPASIPAPAPVGTLLRRGGGRIVANARPPGELQSRRRQEQLRAEEREAAKEARKVSRGIDRMLREQKRDLQQTHRLLLLGRSALVGAGGIRAGPCLGECQAWTLQTE